MDPNETEPKREQEVYICWERENKALPAGHLSIPKMTVHDH